MILWRVLTVILWISGESIVYISKFYFVSCLCKHLNQYLLRETIHTLRCLTVATCYYLMVYCRH